MFTTSLYYGMDYFQAHVCSVVFAVPEMNSLHKHRHFLRSLSHTFAAKSDYKMCVSFQLLILYLCDTHLCLFHFLWVSPHCPWASPLLHCNFFLFEFWGIVLLLCLCFALLSWPRFLLLLKLMFPFVTYRWGWCPYLPASPLTPFFSCCWAQKHLEWKSRLASKLINDNLITFLPTWNFHTSFAPMCHQKWIP